MKKFKKVVMPFIVLGINFGIIQFAVIPLLNESNTIFNIVGAFLGFIVGFFLYTYVDVLINGTDVKEEIPQPFGSDELYETKPKRKYTKKPKQ